MAAFAMVDMASSPAEVKQEVAEQAAPASPKVSVPKYPWGLAIRLEGETLAKLGLDGDLPDVGEMVHFTAMAKVTSASEREQAGTDGKTTSERCVELQITHMAVATSDMAEIESGAREERKRRFYGDKDKPAAAEAA